MSHRMSKSKNLTDAIQEGKDEYKEMRFLGYTENSYIKFALARFLWNEFQDVPMNVEILKVLEKITK